MEKEKTAKTQNNAKNAETKQKLLTVLQAQKTIARTRTMINGLGLKNSAKNRGLVRKLMRELAEENDLVHIESTNQRLSFWYGTKKPPKAAKKKPKPKKNENPGKIVYDPSKDSTRK